MKKQILVLVGVLACSSLAMAGDRGGDGRGGDRLARMQQHLSLTDAQVEEIRAIRENGGSREDVRAILSDEQRAMIEEHRARRGERGGRPPRGSADGE